MVTVSSLIVERVNNMAQFSIKSQLPANQIAREKKVPAAINFLFEENAVDILHPKSIAQAYRKIKTKSR